MYTSNGISSEVAYVYLATGAELGETRREPTELMEIRLVPVREAQRMAREGEITDDPSALALLWCEPLLNSEILLWPGSPPMAGLVLEIGRVYPLARDRLQFPARERQDLLEQLEETGLISGSRLSQSKLTGGMLLQPQMVSPTTIRFDGCGP